MYENSYCDLNEDEYGRPYYSPYDNYLPPEHHQSNNRQMAYLTSCHPPKPDYDPAYPNCVKGTCDTSSGMHTH